MKICYPFYSVIGYWHYWQLTLMAFLTYQAFRACVGGGLSIFLKVFNAHSGTFGNENSNIQRLKMW